MSSVMQPVPSAISDIDDPSVVRVQIYASNQPVTAPLVEAVAAGAVGRLLPDGGDEGDVLTKASTDNYDVIWSKAIGPRAWVNFDGGTPTLRAQFNVASITKNDTGDYTINYSISMDANASVVATAGDSGTPALYPVNLVEFGTAYCRFQVRDSTGTLTDVDLICANVFGTEKNFLILEGDEQTGGLDKIALEGDVAQGVLLTEPSTVV